MHTITIDDESLAVKAMQRVLEKKDPDGTHIGMVKVGDFLDYVISHNDIDVAFIDVEMKTDGITVTKKLRQIAPDINIVIYSGHPQYKADALDQHVSSFIVKPVTEEKLDVALAHLRRPLKSRQSDDAQQHYCAEPLRVITFGNFVVYGEQGKILNFSMTHSLTVFAYLIDQCGYSVTSRDIALNAFEKTEFDAQTSKDISKYLMALIKDLTNAGYGDVVIKQNKTVKVNKSRISCDLYDALRGDQAALSSFRGEYMIDFSWADRSETAHELREVVKRSQ